MWEIGSRVGEYMVGVWGVGLCEGGVVSEVCEGRFAEAAHSVSSVIGWGVVYNE